MSTSVGSVMPTGYVPHTSNVINPPSSVQVKTQETEPEPNTILSRPPLSPSDVHTLTDEDMRQSSQDQDVEAQLSERYQLGTFSTNDGTLSYTASSSSISNFNMLLQPQAIYGFDRRVSVGPDYAFLSDFHGIGCRDSEKIAGSSCSIIKIDKLIRNSDGSYLRINNLIRNSDGSYSHPKNAQVSLNDRVRAKHWFPLGPNVNFRDEPTAAMGSAFLVGPNLLATAAHCVFDREGKLRDLSTLKFVFGYNGIGSVNVNFGADDVYEAERVLDFRFDFVAVYKRRDWKSSNFGGDWAILQLNREVTNHEARSVKLANASPEPGNRVFMLGHPVGLPLKAATGVVQTRLTNVFEATLDSFGGNSGSLVGRKGHEAIAGILIAGPTIEFVRRGNVMVEKDYQGSGNFSLCQKIDPVASSLLRIGTGAPGRLLPFATRVLVPFATMMEKKPQKVVSVAAKTAPQSVFNAGSMLKKVAKVVSEKTFNIPIQLPMPDAALRRIGQKSAKYAAGLSVGVGVWNASKRLKRGEPVKAVAEVVGGLAGTVPGAGTIISMVIDGGLALHDRRLSSNERSAPQQ